jgi:hypothetical protein
VVMAAAATIKVARVKMAAVVAAVAVEACGAAGIIRTGRIGRPLAVKRPRADRHR